VSESIIKRARTIAARGAEEDIEAVKKGELSINQAYQKVRQKKDDSLTLHPSPVIDTILEETGIDAGPDITTEADESSSTDEASGPDMDILSGAEPIRELPEDIPDYSKIGDSSNIRFLRFAVILLSENDEMSAADLLITHFLKKRQRDLFLEVVPSPVRKKISGYQDRQTRNDGDG
jgi:hypothetical protein